MRCFLKYNSYVSDIFLGFIFIPSIFLYFYIQVNAIL